MQFPGNFHSKLIPEIKIHTGSIEELIHIESSLTKINSGPCGHELLKRIKMLSTHGRHVQIMTHDRENGVGGMLTHSQIQIHKVNRNSDSDEHFNKMLELARIKPNGDNNEGVVAIVKININKGIMLDQDGFPTYLNSGKEMCFVSLAHELVHAYNLMNGTYRGGYSFDQLFDENSDMRLEEDRAVGVGIYKGSGISENGVRYDHHLPLRASYLTREQIFISEQLKQGHIRRAS
ncbi:hypothetical protein F3J37_01615 [Pantoea sp. Al-1710]|uniref:Effector protein n=1 Tax=Candidatus Pantoea communis TaxID=2608354 RepID=A0ABX0RIC8_9GAMM|nr:MULTISPECIES: M91 family zinc metallopeptidase [Pantoea]NIG12923.1 hypothetical protein [Pantoea sp. Cy-640]NIG17376.1 hypothetical protein [Pantoea communis]